MLFGGKESKKDLPVLKHDVGTHTVQSTMISWSLWPINKQTRQAMYV